MGKAGRKVGGEGKEDEERGGEGRGGGRKGNKKQRQKEREKGLVVGGVDRTRTVNMVRPLHVVSHQPVLLLKQMLSGSSELKSVRQSVREMAILCWQTQWGCGHGNSTMPVPVGLSG